MRYTFDNVILVFYSLWFDLVGVLLLFHWHLLSIQIVTSLVLLHVAWFTMRWHATVPHVLSPEEVLWYSCFGCFCSCCKQLLKLLLLLLLLLPMSIKEANLLLLLLMLLILQRCPLTYYWSTRRTWWEKSRLTCFCRRLNHWC